MRFWGMLTASFLAVVVSVDIQPQALEMLKAKENTAWISNVYYSCVRGTPFAIVESGVPDDPENFTVIEAGEMKIYVPEIGIFSGDIPQLAVFPRRNGQKNVGVANRLD